MIIKKFALGSSLFDLIALFVVVLGSVSSFAMALDSFVPSRVLGLTILLTILSFSLLFDQKQLVPRPQRNDAKRCIGYAAIGVLAISLRLGQYTNLQGGQDQGLYVNMASTLYKWGSIQFPDTFRASLDQTAKHMYDQTHISALSLVDSLHSTMTIEFYPLHPALMAICRFVFGGYGLQSLFLMSLLSVVVAWYLAIEIDGRQSVATLFTLFIAINPALTFFSKFPVSETVALSYVLIGMLYFLRYLRIGDSKVKYFNLLVSLLSFNCLFYVRWQFFLYVPFFLALLVGSFLRPSGGNKQHQLLKFSLLVFGLFALSMLFYMKKQPELYSYMRAGIIDLLPFSTRLTVLTLIAILLMLLIFIVKKVSMFFEANFVQKFETALPKFLVVVLIVSIPSIIALYKGIPMYPWDYSVPSDIDRWVIRYHFLYRLALFTSPWLFITTIVMVSVSKVREKNHSGLILFVLICLGGVHLRPYVPYLYYYGRYLIVDLLPAFLLLGSVSLVNLWSKRRALSLMCGILSVSYFLFFSLVLVGKREGDRSEFFTEVSSVVSGRDVLLLGTSSQLLLLPLRTTFGIPTLGIPTPDTGIQQDVLIEKFKEVAKIRHGSLYYLAMAGSGIDGMKPLRSFEYDDSFLTNTDHFRGKSLLHPKSLSRLLLPYQWEHSSVTWELYDLSQNERS